MEHPVTAKCVPTSYLTDVVAIFCYLSLFVLLCCYLLNTVISNLLINHEAIQDKGIFEQDLRRGDGPNESP